jgi:hypothetical protein
MSVTWVLFGAICWTLWLNRNDFVFNNSLISSPRAIGFRLLSFLQHWGGRGADGGQECAAAGR